MITTTPSRTAPSEQLLARREFPAAWRIPDVHDATFVRRGFRAFRPRPRVRLLEWCVTKGKTHTDTPYSHTRFPHIGAPGGPCDAVDDHHVRQISQQFAAQVSKTFFSQLCTLFWADTDPSPQIFGSATETLAKEVIERTYGMIHRIPDLNAKLLKGEREQRQGLIEFTESMVYVAWARSVATLGDKSVKRGHANEIDKWEHTSTSREAHPLQLFYNRFKQFWQTRKVLLESTPTVTGRSAIENLRLAGTNCRYEVPCPHCQRYQALEFGDETTAYGVKWDRDGAGRTNPTLAKKTAHYVCRHCHEKILDQHRSTMMRRGVWVPEGCTVDDVKAAAAVKHYAEVLQRNLRQPDFALREKVWFGWKHAPWVLEDPVRDGEDASYQLSSLYSLSLGWGDIAKEFVMVKPKPHLLRDFINSWLALTWQIQERTQTWEELGRRIIVPIARGVVPAWAGLVTIGIDKQSTHYVYTVNAWGSGRTKHTLEYGTCKNLDELRKVILNPWKREGGGTLVAALSLIDAGFRPAEVYAFAKRCRSEKIRLQVCRGSSVPLGTYFSRKTLGKKTSAPGQKVIWVDPNSTQDALDRQLYSLEPPQEGSASLYEAPLGEHQDYLEQLLNDASVSGLDAQNMVRENWQRMDENTPNDYRDADRYSFVGMLVATRGAPIRPLPPVNELEERIRERSRLRGISRDEETPAGPRLPLFPANPELPAGGLILPSGPVQLFKMI